MRTYILFPEFMRLENLYGVQGQQAMLSTTVKKEKLKLIKNNKITSLQTSKVVKKFYNWVVV